MVSIGAPGFKGIAETSFYNKNPKIFKFCKIRELRYRVIKALAIPACIDLSNKKTNTHTAFGNLGVG
jgi:hypothetical protein